MIYTILRSLEPVWELDEDSWLRPFLFLLGVDEDE